MSTAAYYHEEAKRYRERAAASPGSEDAKHWLRFAADYDLLANLLEGSDSQSPVAPVPGQQQPAQRESKTRWEGKE